MLALRALEEKTILTIFCYKTLISRQTQSKYFEYRLKTFDCQGILLCS